MADAKAAQSAVEAALTGRPEYTNLARSSSGVDRYRCRVQAAVASSFRAYLASGVDADDLRPVTGGGVSWLHARATLYDSLDTLWIVGEHDLFREARRLVLSLGLPLSSVVFPSKVFEFHIRVVGGLLGAFSVSGDVALLECAEAAAALVLERAFYASPSSVPYSDVRLYVPLLRGGSVRGYAEMNVDSDIATANHMPLPPGGLWNVFWRWWDWVRVVLDPLSLVAKVLDWARFYWWEAEQKETRSNSLAGMGSFGLELRALTLLTGNSEYSDTVERVFEVVSEAWRMVGGVGESRKWGEEALAPHFRPPKLIPMRWRVSNGQPLSSWGAGLGSGGDSFYEYLVKEHLLRQGQSISGGGGRETAGLPHADVTELAIWLVRGLAVGKIQNVADIAEGVSILSSAGSFHALECYVPGLLALTAHQLRRGKTPSFLSPEHLDGTDALGVSSQALLEMSEKLMRGCMSMYYASETLLAPEMAVPGYVLGREVTPLQVEGDGFAPIWDKQPTRLHSAGDARYVLRPEAVESLFYMYRVTQNPVYRMHGMAVFDALKSSCFVEGTGGFSGLKDVREAAGAHHPGNWDDQQPSYFIAETLKYLYLLFASDDLVSLDHYVFTTEAHPLYCRFRDRCSDAMQRQPLQKQDEPTNFGELPILPVPLPPTCSWQAPSVLQQLAWCPFDILLMIIVMFLCRYVRKNKPAACTRLPLNSKVKCRWLQGYRDRALLPAYKTQPVGILESGKAWCRRQRTREKKS